MSIRAARTCLITLVAVAGALAVAPAHAQFYGGFYGWQERDRFFEPDAAPAASPRMIQARLARQGYRVVGPMRLRGDVIIADAIGPSGVSMRLIVDSDDGTILQRFARSEPRPPAALRDEPADSGFDPMDEPQIIHGPNTGNPAASAAARPPKIAAPKPAVKLKPAPKTVARNTPEAPVLAPPPKPAVTRAPPAKPAPGTLARTAPADVIHPAVSDTPAPATSVKPSVAQTAASAPPPAAPPPEKKNGETGAPLVNGVPLNPLD